MNLADILDFANTVVIEDIEPTIARQIEYNTAIAAEGMTGKWGSAVGKTLMDVYGDSILNRARAIAAAGSDARMNGCEMPVIINSGSGNQGMTTSLPVIEYAKELGVDKEKMYRALVLANLVTIHQKTTIGRLSAFCGAVSAGAGAGAGIAYLSGGDFEAVVHTVINAVAIVSGGNDAFGVMAILGYVLAALGAFLGASLSLHMMRSFSRKIGFSGFAYYCWGTALFTFIMYLSI
jgi:L-cysteine desulfidase